MNEVLVTGGAGYIGAHVCKALRIAGFLPVTVDNLSTGFQHNVKWGPFHNLDLRDKERLQSQLNCYNFVGVIHLAASAYVSESYYAPLKYFSNNLVSTINLLEFMITRKISKLVFSSSCAVYGSGDGRPFRENSIKEPINNYGLSKKMCEEVISHTAHSHNINFINLRFFNASGVDKEGEIREEHNPETHVIPLLVDSALNGKNFTIYGNDYDTVDGSPIRDYVHVQDLAAAHVHSLNYLANFSENLILNLGSGRGTSVLELVEGIKNFGLTPKISFGERRLGDPPTLVADCSFAKEKLNWSPSYSGLQSILSSVIKSRLAST